MTTLTDFLLARIAEDEAGARAAQHQDQPTWRADLHSRDAMGRKFSVIGSSGQFRSSDAVEHVVRFQPSRVLAECEAKRRIIDLHQDWPVLVDVPETTELIDGGLDTMTYRISRQMGWLTTREYVARFGTEPPTTPILLTLAQVYADHPDYDPAWSA